MKPIHNTWSAHPTDDRSVNTMSKIQNETNSQPFHSIELTINSVNTMSKIQNETNSQRLV